MFNYFLLKFYTVNNEIKTCSHLFYIGVIFYRDVSKLLKI